MIQLPSNLMTRQAEISDDGNYRWWLIRSWGRATIYSHPYVVWIMLNPSTADAEVDDPTIKKCVSFTRQFGFQAMVVINLMAWRATEPKDLLKVAHPVGRFNYPTWRTALTKNCGLAICAWGQVSTKLRVYESLGRKELRRLALLTGKGDDFFHYLRMGQRGPCHPLYLPSNLTPIAWPLDEVYRPAPE